MANGLQDMYDGAVTSATTLWRKYQVPSCSWVAANLGWVDILPITVLLLYDDKYWQIKEEEKSCIFNLKMLIVTTMTLSVQVKSRIIGKRNRKQCM